MDDSVPRVCLLGGFSVATEDGVVDERAWRLRKAKALVKLLALAPERRLHRERLAELLWPDRDADAAANNLHQALHAARRAIGADALRLERRRRRPRGRRSTSTPSRPPPPTRASRPATPPPTSARSTSTPASCCPRTATSRGPTRAAPRCSSCTAPCASSSPSCTATTPQAVAALQRALVVDPLAEPAHRALMRALRGHRPPPAGAGAVPAPAPAARRRAGGRARPRDPRALPRAAGARRRRRRRGAATSRAADLVRRPRARARRDRAPARPRPPAHAHRPRAAAARRAWRSRRWRTRSSRCPTASGSSSSPGLSDGALVAQAAALAVGVPIPAQRSAQEALAAHLASARGDRRARQLRARDRRVRAPGRGPAARRARRARAGHEPRAAALRGRGRLARARRWPRPSRLFVERAAARPGLQRRRATTQAPIDEICRRLDGMPLAIELAAARVAALSLEQIAARLGDSLDVLAAGSRTARTRQQTLRATIDWSHDLLTGEERVLFRRLAVFAGGFTLEAAEEVCAGGAIARRRIVDLLARLVDKSLVSRGPAQRFRLLDTIRQYAAERLDAAGERDTVGRAPPRLVPGAGRGARPAVGRPAALAAHARDRARQPARRPRLRPAPRSRRRRCGWPPRLWRFWLDRGYFAEGNRWLRGDAGRGARADAAARRGAARGRRACRCAAATRTASCATSSDAVGAYRAARATSARPPRRSTSTRCSRSPSTPRDAEALFAEALALARRLGDDRLLAAATHASATLPWYRGDTRPLARVVLEALALLERRPRRRHAVLRRGDLRDVPARRGAGGPAADALGGDDLPLPPLRPRPGHRLRAQQPRLGRARRRRPRAGAGRPRRGARALPAPRGPARARRSRLTHMGSLARSLGDFERRARASARGARRCAASSATRARSSCSTMALGLLGHDGRRRSRAGRALLSEALARAEAVDDLPAMAGVQTNWALAEERRGELERAERAARRRRARCWDVQRLRRFEGWAQIALHDVRERLGDEAGRASARSTPPARC